MTLKDWLQLFRAQTSPATLCLILTPFLSGEYPVYAVFLLGFFAVVVHYLSFGENSLLDTAMGYDRRDPAKKHHPLIAHRIKMATAHRVIHWSLCLAAVWGVLLTWLVSPAPFPAMVALFLWYVFGAAYNNGLSKESPVGFLSISLCFSAAGGWGWFLSHNTWNVQGVLFVVYLFFTLLFQCSWSGHLKEMQQRERSNILLWMGAKVEPNWKGEKMFTPGTSKVYGWTVKLVNLGVAGLLLYAGWSLPRLAWFLTVSFGAVYCAYQLIKPRKYIRSKELFNMSLMEILTIYLPIPLMLGWWEATVLMVVGVTYFFSMNKLLWTTSYPKV